MRRWPLAGRISRRGEPKLRGGAATSPRSDVSQRRTQAPRRVRREAAARVHLPACLEAGRLPLSPRGPGDPPRVGPSARPRVLEDVAQLISVGVISRRSGLVLIAPPLARSGRVAGTCVSTARTRIRSRSRQQCRMRRHTSRRSRHTPRRIRHTPSKERHTPPRNRHKKRRNRHIPRRNRHIPRRSR